MNIDINLILNICGLISGIIVCIPIVIKLVQVSKEAIKNKNWNQVLSLLLDLIKIAEASFTAGSQKKEYVINELKLQADKLDYTITSSDWVKISNMIDSLIEMSKVVNVK